MKRGIQKFIKNLILFIKVVSFLVAFTHRLIHLSSAKIFQISESDLNLATLTAVEEILTQHRCQKTTIIIENNLEVDADEIIKHIEKNIKVEVAIDCNKVNKGRCNIFMFNSINSLMKIEKEITGKNFKFFGEFLLTFWHQCQVADLELIFETLWEKQIFNLYALCRGADGEILLVTFDPFMNTSTCGKAIPKIIYSFREGKFSEPLRFEPKFSDLNQCRIPVTPYADGFGVFINKFKNGTEFIDGYEIRVVKAIAKSMNFEIIFNFHPRTDQFGTIFENGTATAPFTDLMSKKSDILFGDFYLRTQRLKFLDASVSIGYLPVLFIASQGEKLSALQKLLAPFSVTVWFLLTAAFLAGIVMNFLINCHSTRIKNSEFSEKFKHPVTAMFATFLSIPHTTLPKKDFMRIFLMIFMISCLIMGSLYQGSLYKFLQSDQRQKVPSTIPGLLKNEYQFVIPDAWVPALQNDPKVLERRLPFDNFKEKWESEDRLALALGHSSKRAMIASQQYLLVRSRTSREFPYKIIKENLLTSYVVQYYRKDFFLGKAIDDKLGKIFEAGLIKKWISEYDFTGYWKEQEEGPKVLTLTHLWGIFLVLLIGYAFSTFVFLIEFYTRLI